MNPPPAVDPSLRQAVEDIVVRMFVATDERDWGVFPALFADPFVLDMSSMTGGQPATFTPQQVAAAWDAGFRPLDHVHHQIGNLRTEIEGAQARVRCYGIALHHRAAATGGTTRRFVGTYDIRLSGSDTGWRITRLAFLLKFIDGNLALEA